MNLVLISLILLLGFSSYYFGRKKATIIQSSQRLTALPKFYGYYLAIWCAAPALIIFSLWSVFEPTIVKNFILADYLDQNLTKNELQLIYTKVKALALGTYTGDINNFLDNSAGKYIQIKNMANNAKIVIVLAALILSLSYAYQSIKKNNRMREPVEIFLKWVLFTASLAAVLVTIGIVFSLLFEAIRFFQSVRIFDFIFGTHWYPAKTFVRDGQPDPELMKDAFGAVPLFAGTFFIAFIAMCVAIPVGLLSGIYLAEYATRKVRKYAKPIIEILAGIPTVVYGFFAALTVGPFVKEIGNSLGLEVSSESALAAGAVMGVMIIPFISSLSDDVISAVPQNFSDGCYEIRDY